MQNLSEIVHRHEPTSVLLQHEKALMSIAKVKFATGTSTDAITLNGSIRLPANRFASRKDQIERIRCQMQGLVHNPLSEVGL